MGRLMYLIEQPWFLLAGLLTSVGVVFANFPIPLVIVVLMGMMVIDVIVGLLVAGANGEITSKRSFQGGVRKVIMLLIVLASWLIQLELSLLVSTHLGQIAPDLPDSVPLVEFVAGYFLLYEFISILELAVKAGIKLPSQFTRLLKVGQEDVVSQ